MDEFIIGHFIGLLCGWIMWEGTFIKWIHRKDNLVKKDVDGFVCKNKELMKALGKGEV